MGLGAAIPPRIFPRIFFACLITTMIIRLIELNPLRNKATMALDLPRRVIFDYHETHTKHLRHVKFSSLPSFGKSMLNHPRQLGGLLPRLGNITYLCFYLFAIVTSM